MRGILQSVALGGLALLTSTGLAWPDDPEAGPSPSELRFGSDDQDNPRANAVVWVNGCTGTLLAPDVVVTAGHCIGGRPRQPAGVDAHPGCADWESPGQWYPLSSRITIGVGVDQRAFSQTERATHYTLPGCADIMMLKLANPIPSARAVPSRVLVSAGGGKANDDAGRLRDQRLRQVGWGIDETGVAPPIRQRGQSRYRSADGSFVYTKGLGGLGVRSGDSGSPLFWDHPSGQRLLVGVAQGWNPGADLGRYTATFRGPTDVSPHIGNWIWTHVPDAVYCEQALAAPAGTIPLVAYWSARRTDNFLTSDPRWAGCHGTVRSPDYDFVRSEGFVFDPKRPRPAGTVPLFSWWHRDRGDNFISSDPRWSTDPARIRWQGEHVAGGPSQGGYTLYRLEGWVFDPKRPQPRGTVPIYSWWDGNRTDNFATSNPLWNRVLDPARIVWAGEHIRNQPTQDSYTLYRLEGYAYPTRCHNARFC